MSLLTTPLALPFAFALVLVLPLPFAFGFLSVLAFGVPAGLCKVPVKGALTASAFLAAVRCGEDIIERIAAASASALRRRS